MNETKTSDKIISLQAVLDVLTMFNGDDAITAIRALPSAQPDLSAYSDKLWRTAYERGKEEAQADVIRCRDCKYWMPHSQLGFDEENGTYHDYCERLVPEDEYYAFYRNAEDYCSRAERREDG